MTTTISPLRQRMIEDMNGRELTRATQQGHIRACQRFAAFLGRSPEDARPEYVRRRLYLEVAICCRPVPGEDASAESLRGDNFQSSRFRPLFVGLPEFGLP